MIARHSSWAECSLASGHFFSPALCTFHEPTAVLETLLVITYMDEFRYYCGHMMYLRAQDLATPNEHLASSKKSTPMIGQPATY